MEEAALIVECITGKQGIQVRCQNKSFQQAVRCTQAICIHVI